MTVSAVAEQLAARIRDVPDFPSPGIVFKDITPILGHGPSFRLAIDALAAPWEDRGITKVLGIEARGFVLGAPVADRLCAGFVPLRKAGKLPAAVVGTEYALEYGVARIEAHLDGVVAGERVVIIDDVLATGGTAAAAVEVARLLGAEVVGLGFLLELGFLEGRRRLDGQTIDSVMRF
jgi:adenine phosphoribosyltransferase